MRPLVWPIAMCRMCNVPTPEQHPQTSLLLIASQATYGLFITQLYTSTLLGIRAAAHI